MQLRRVSRVRVVTILAVALAAVLALAYLLSGARGDGGRQVITAEFTSAEGVYVGSQVRIVGVEVGIVEKIEPTGDVARVQLSLDPGTRLPADVGAVVMNPAVIADRFVELAPAYVGGPTFPDDGVIPAERTRAPLDFDEFVSSLDTLSSAFSPGADEVAQGLDRGAEALDGRGETLSRAIRNLSTVTAVGGHRAEDLDAIVTELAVLMDAAGGRDQTMRDLVQGLDDLGRQLRDDQIDVAAPAEDLRVILDDLDAIVAARGDDITGTTAATREVTALYARHRADFAEFLDLYPVMMDNLAGGIGPDGRARIRLNVSSNITHFARGRELCQREPLPLCTGAGLTNPLMFPVEQSDPIGLLGAFERVAGGG
ncbi:MCE family protein [Dietzia psychralcaliphila]|uniref:MCE family protein n=1 Tax=Dietzia psychralcaliphila TaxID=139021 RepID=UPI000D31539A|nr:MCE family protein [Dietzia psychralcaliphila]PTM89640.1 phospholipid/cholesterol/gamma-HCH transport system substrate-binding protein [Dietzia psychralcaliphila]